MGRVLSTYIGVLILVLALPSMSFADTVLTGTVLEDASGNHVSAGILAYRQNDSGDWDFAGSEQTDSEGRFSFNYLGTGTFYLECEAYVDCDPQEYSCADKYLPQLYSNVPVYEFANKTIVTLEQDVIKELDTIRVKTRPFYFETVTNSCTQARKDGLVKITGQVVNTTGRRAGIWFSGVMDSPQSEVYSDFYGLSSSYPLGDGELKILKPGMNTVTFSHRMDLL